MLTIENAVVKYGQSAILRDVSLDVPDGSVVCLLGRNGVGKTTLMKSIMGIEKLQGGAMTLDGANMKKWATSQRARAGLGYVPQGRGIFPKLTVYENMLMGFEALSPSKPRKEDLDEVYAIFPVLEEMKNRVAGTLSGGQQQQLAFGRVLVRKPKMLLLDEPTEGIQPSIMLEIEDVILDLRSKSNLSILLVEQYLDFALNVGDYFYVMETGSIALGGPAGEFDAQKAREYLAV